MPSKVKAATSNDTQTSSSDVDSRINLQTTEFNVSFFLNLKAYVWLQLESSTVFYNINDLSIIKIVRVNLNEKCVFGKK